MIHRGGIKLKSVLVMMLASSLLAVALRANAETSVVGFQSWKSARVDEARNALEKLQDAVSAKDKKLKNKPVDPKVQQAQVGVAIAQELTVNDYFLLYLRQFKHKEALVEAAKKLSPDEIADLLIAYQKHLAAGSQEVEMVIPTSAQIAPTIPSATK